ncbi:MAG: hypothetical protein OEU26_33795 [Candidatus Tectomicrobia bacterium]|nr:hypothetical protein [Candidatus Tectomicrobia bacterium]
MNPVLRILSILSLIFLVILGTIAVSGTQPRVSARIGIQIQSNGGMMRAKVRNRVKVGDGLRLYVAPVEDAYIYVIRTDKKVAQVLNPEPYKTPAKTAMILPNEGQFYNIDGSSSVESFTVICSPTELKEVQELIGSPTFPYQTWVAVEQKLIEKSRIDLTEDVTKPFSIAGVVRHLASDQEFLKRLPMLSGNTLVVKTYDFTVKK